MSRSRAFLHRSRPRAEDGLRAALLAGLRRMEPDRTVLLTEYPVTPRPLWGWSEPVNEAVRQVLDASLPAVEQLAVELNELADWCATIPLHPAPDDPLAWDNPYWASVDAVMQVHALRTRRCQTYLEVGSGYSTMFARRAIDDFDLPTRIVSVDPAPRADIDRLCDDVLRAPFQDVAEQAISLLAPGDLFVFDGSHLATMGSDATWLLCGGLDHIPSGVLVGIDDIFLPSDYPETWVERWYGEQYLVAAWLLGGAAGWEVVLPGWHATTSPAHPHLFDPLWPHIEAWGGRRATTFWMERRPS